MNGRALWVALFAVAAGCSHQTIDSPVPPVPPVGLAPVPAAVAAPAFVQRCASSPSTAVTSLVVSCPSPPVAGDVLYAFVYVYNAAAAITPAAGSWNKAIACTNATNNSLTVFSHAVGPAEGSAYKWSWNAAYYAHVNLFEVRGANAASPIDGKACSSVTYGAAPQTVTSGAAAAQAGDLPIFQSGESNAFAAPSAGSASGASTGACTMRESGNTGAIYLAGETCPSAGAPGTTSATMRYPVSPSGGYVTALITAAHAVEETRHIDYVFVAQPDDEIEGWAAFENDPQAYPVFIIVTRGENTSFCDTVSYNQGWEPQNGELPPSPVPSQRGTLACKEARINSFNRFMDAMATVDPQHDDAIGAAPPIAGTGPVPSADCSVKDRSYLLWVGAHHARLILDLGDGLTLTCNIPWALQTARSINGLLPVHGERDAIGDSFYGTPATCGDNYYMNPVHQTIYTAMHTIRLGVPGKQEQMVCRADGATLAYELP